MRHLRLVLIALSTSAAPAARLAAQVCTPPADSHEARLLAFYSAPLAFSPAAAPAVSRAGSVRIDVEVEPMPTPSATIRQSSLCYQAKEENTKLAPVFGRPRVTVGLPAGFSVEASYLPPVQLWDAKPNLASFAIAHVQSLPVAASLGAVTLLLRAHGTVGKVQGPITCPASSLGTSPDSACYGTQPSNDTFHPYMVGGEGALGLTTPGGRWSLYAGGGVTRLYPRFQVGFTNTVGATDRTRVEVNLTRGVVFGGVSAHLSPVVDLSAQIYSVPADVTTFRFGAGYRLR